MKTRKTISSKKFGIRSRAIAEGYRSGLEETTGQDLTLRGVGYTYEELVIEYTKPESKHKYTPDFVLLHNGIIVETKGRFLSEDRKKHILVKQQHPHLDIRFVFSSSKTKISKTSKTSYAMWCESKGFLYADKKIPEAWLQEKGKS
ncbi:endodeoxyribonuclease [Methylovorus sp. MM2]|uniref:endodeoxyribonuclease n=1 Tax=Methylovorus sp. MM2 TaxID=1848038 RepID=UPI0007E09ED9|nr:endodeoxyribonuclease [Methylovorus sp. MM2]OAM52901.1 endodeoxyribonuclease [Methylovorus sp. MM2]